MTARTDMGPFAMVPLWLFTALTEKAPGSVGSALQVWVALHKWANHATHHAVPSKQKIADLAGVSIKTVERSLNLLRNVGALEWKQRHDEHGDLTSNDYLLCYADPHLVTVGSDTDDPTGSDTGDVETRSSLNQKNPPRPPQGGATRRKSSTSWPEGWEPDQKLRDWTHENCPHIDGRVEFEKFHAYALAHDRRYVRWEQAWRQWALKAEQDAAARKPQTPRRVNLPL